MLTVALLSFCAGLSCGSVVAWMLTLAPGRRRRRRSFEMNRAVARYSSRYTTDPVEKVRYALNYDWGSRRRRRGGYVKPPVFTASRSVSVHTATSTPGHSDGTTELTLRAAGGCSSYRLPGGVSAAWEIPRTLHDPSRLTGRGWSTLGTVDRGASGAQRAPAGSRSLLRTVASDCHRTGVAT